MATSSNVNARIARFLQTTERADEIVNGSDTTEVLTDGGLVPSFAKQLKDMETAFEDGVGGIFDTVVGGYANEAKAARDDTFEARDEAVATVPTQGATAPSDPIQGAQWTSDDGVRFEWMVIDGHGQWVEPGSTISIGNETADSVEAAAIAATQAKVDAEAAASNAVPAAATATAQATIATTQAGLASTHSNTAQLAASSALIQSGNFPDQSTGHAATTDNQAFKVQGSADVAAYEFRRLNSTTDQLIAVYPGVPRRDLAANAARRTGFYLGTTGSEVAAANWGYTTYLPVSPGKFVFFSGRASTATGSVVFYDKNYAIVSVAVIGTAGGAGSVFTNVAITVPVGAVFARISGLTSEGYKLESYDLGFAMLDGLFVDEPTGRSRAQDGQIFRSQGGGDVADYVWRRSSSASSELLSASLSLLKRDIVESAVRQMGRYLNASGVETAANNWSYTAPVAVTPGKLMWFTGVATSFVGSVVFYNASDVIVEVVVIGTSSTATTYTDVPIKVPAGAATARASGLTANGFKLDCHSLPLSTSTGAPVSHWSGKKWAAFGDSITDSKATPNTYPPQVAAGLGLTLFDYARSGSRIRDAFYYATTSASLAGVNLATIAHATNDFKLETPLGSISDAVTLPSAGTPTIPPVLNGTFYSDYKSVIETLLGWAPDMRIAMFTPIRRMQAAATGTDTNSLGLKLTDYAEAVRVIARYYSLPLLDLHDRSGFNLKTIPTWTIDLLHPTADAQTKVLVPMVSGFIGQI